MPSTAQINLDWPDSTDPSVIGYNLYRATVPDFVPAFDNMIAFDLEDSFFEDVECRAATTYYYKIAPVSEDGIELPIAHTGSATTLSSDVSLPLAPTIREAFGANSTEITLRWDDNSANEAEFRILQSDGVGGWTLAATTEPNAEAHTIRNLNPDTNYTFALQAANTLGTSPTTAPTTASTQPADYDYFVMLVGGHTQRQSELDAGVGVGAIRDLLRVNNPLRMDVHIYAEDGRNATINVNGTGQAYVDFRRAFDRGVRRWAIIGYSHGASMAYQFARRVNQENPLVNPARLGFSGSIDGIQRNRADHGFELILAETRLPPGTLHHRNEYQLRDPLHGNVVPGANVNNRVLVTDGGRAINHRNIDDQPSLLQRFRDQLIQWLQAMP
ncbi:MAG TPA: fibronectin type III domain-containing protein [Tepidisphaeraceae bacterium]|nr:fibronectin type III domain-containing protein [Tepidisphaeraceae bacterium]